MSPESTEDVCYSPFNSEGGGANSNDHSYNAILLQTPVDVTACPSIDNPSKLPHPVVLVSSLHI